MAISRFDAFVRIAKEKSEATATRPHAKTAAAINTSMSVKPLLCFKEYLGETGRAGETLVRGRQQIKTGLRLNQMTDVPSNQLFTV